MSKQCQKCSSNRILSLSGKTSDCFGAQYQGQKYDGYVLSDVGIGEDTSDYIEFSYCLECGQIQGKFPIDEKTLQDQLNPEN